MTLLDNSLMDMETARDKRGVFAWIMHRDVHEYFDVDGRPIGEGRSQAFAQVETSYKSCPFAGSRHHHPKPMNMSALQSILPAWQTSLALLAQLSGRYQAFYRKEVTTYYDLALISGMGVFLADYMALRRNEPLISLQFPVWMSGLYKVCLGFQQATFLAMMNEQFATRSEEQALPDATGFYAYLEEQLLLIGEAEVCGGSEEMISRAYETMQGKHPLAEGVNPVPLACGLEIDWNAYDVFTFHSSNMWRQAILFGMYMQTYQIEVHISGVPTSLLSTCNDLLKSSFDRLLHSQSGVSVEMAQLTLAESGRSFAEWQRVQADLLLEINCPGPGDTNSQLADVIVVQLLEHIDLGSYQAVIVAAICKQLAEYTAFESAIVHACNQHLDQISTALGYVHAGGSLTTADLSAVYGKTVHDWPEFMKQS
jgi:hypothetical protein